MSGFTDRFGRAWAQTTVGGQDRYACGGLTVSFPQGTAQAQAQAAAEINAPAGTMTSPLTIPKTTIIRRATDAEIATLDAWLANTATVRQRRMWIDAGEGEVIIADVLPLATALFGAKRAVDLLA